MKKIHFATNNPHKQKEIQQLLNNSFEVIGLQQLGIFEDIPETGNTLEENAIQKAQWLYDQTQTPCFADDTGLEVEVLDGQPGVYSARYAGKAKSFDDNIDKLLKELEGKTNRKACFRTVIAFIRHGGVEIFEGRVDGIILHEKRGKEGFGYDPIFQPDGYDKTYAQMKLEEKNQISHRALATQKLIAFLKTTPFSE